MTAPLDRATFDQLTRLDLYTFVQRVQRELNPSSPFLENWHIELMAAELMAAWRGECPQLMINLPPRNLKSLCVSIAFVAWALGHDPTKRFLVVSYGAELAEKLGRDTRQVMTSAWYQTLFPRCRLSASRYAAHDLETTLGGGRLAGSRGGPITGRGAHFVIVDDLLKADEALLETAREAAYAFFTSTLSSRVEKQHGVTIVAAQRLHEDDICGKLLRAGGWRHLCLPAIATRNETFAYDTPFGPRLARRRVGEALHPEREPLQALARVKAMQGEYHFTAQYQQNPIPLDGNLVKIGNLKRYTPAHLPECYHETLFSLDCAYKANDRADYTVIQRWGRRDQRYYLLGQWRMKADYHDMKLKVRALSREHHPDRILVEDSASGQSLIQELRHEGFHGVTGVPVRQDKTTRMSLASILVDEGAVLIPEAAPWLADFLHELAGFPHGRHDDQADAFSQALNYFRIDRQEPPPIRFAREELAKIHGLTIEGPGVVMKAPGQGTTMHYPADGRPPYYSDPVTRECLVRQYDMVSALRAGWTIVSGWPPAAR